MGESMVSNKKISRAESGLSLLGCSGKQMWASIAFWGHFEAIYWCLDPLYSYCPPPTRHMMSLSPCFGASRSLATQWGHRSAFKAVIHTLPSSSYWQWVSPSLFSTWRIWFRYCALGKLCLWIPSILHIIGFCIHSLGITTMVTSCKHLTVFVLDICGSCAWMQRSCWKENFRVWP